MKLQVSGKTGAIQWATYHRDPYQKTFTKLDLEHFAEMHQNCPSQLMGWMALVSFMVRPLYLVALPLNTHLRSRWIGRMRERRPPIVVAVAQATRNT